MRHISRGNTITVELKEDGKTTLIPIIDYLWCRYDMLEYDKITGKTTIYSSDKKIGQINDLIY